LLNSYISRREFIKFLGLGLTVFVFGGFSKLSDLAIRPTFPKRALAQQSLGSWSAGRNTTTPAIHIALLPSGKIFYLAGSGFDNARQSGPFNARILNVNTGSERSLTQTEDLFCTGLTSLADGKVFMAGGTLRYNGNPDNCNGRWHGLKSAYELDPSSESMTKVASMRHGRWYPTLVTLPDGKVWTCMGDDEYGVPNRIVEVYDPTSKAWTIRPDPSSTRTYCVGSGFSSTCPGAGSPCYNNACPTLSFYPRAHLMPNGRLVITGFRREIYSWNPADGRFTLLGNTRIYRDYGTTFLCPLNNTSSEKGKILVVGGSATVTDPATTSVEMLDFNASSSSVPVIRNVSPIAHRRKFPNPVILPNGKLVIFGGHENVSSIKVLIPEMFDPITETWQDLPAATVPRSYHGVALLLPDGRVWVAGSAPSKGVWERRTEFFSPGYLFAGTRPTISGAPTVGGYGGTITIPTPSPTNARSVSLVRLMATTHHYDANQRLVWLQIINRGSSSVTVSAPINANIAPRGYYMIHVLNSSGVPSVGRIVKIPR
jgi:hypothetical protein